MRWNFHSSPSRTMVCPALLPPWKRITRSACSASRSVILPLPSSPHWAPTITMPDIAGVSLRGRAPPARRLAVGGQLVVPFERTAAARRSRDVGRLPRRFVARRAARHGVRRLQPAVAPVHALGVAADLVDARDG